MNRKLRPVTLTLVHLLGLLAVAVAAPRPVPASERTLSGVVYLGDLPTMVAEARDLFRDAGVDLTITYRLSGKRNLAALRRGETDFALMALTPLVLDQLRDRTPGQDDDPVILANLAHGIDLEHVVVLNGNGRPAAMALTGKRIGMVNGTNARFMWSLFTMFHDVDTTSVRTVDLPIDAIPDALADERIDGAVVWQPWTDRLKRRFGERLRVLPSSQVYAAKWVLVARRATVIERPELCRRVLRAYHRAVHWIKANPDAAAAIYRRRAGVDGGTGEAIPERLFYDLSLDWSVVSSLLQHGSWAARNGFTTGPVAPLDLIAPGPLRDIRPDHVHIPDDESGSDRGDTDR